MSPRKNLQRRVRALSLRAWLVLTVVAVVCSIIVAEMVMGHLMANWQQQADLARLSAVRSLIGVEAAPWHDPAWQRRTATALAGWSVEAQVVQVTPGSPGRTVFATAHARAYLETAAPSSGGADAGNGVAPDSTAAFERIVIWGAPRPGMARAPSGIAFLWFTQQAPGSPSPWWWAVAAGSAILLVLAVVVWLLGRYVLRPLAAMSRAAEGIAGGDLDVRLPPAGAREVAEVAVALEGMSAALRQALAQQSALEEQRRRLDEERKLFIGAIAHDLRTPLFMLRGYLKGLESGVAATPEKMAHYVAASRAKADALERLIADLFAYTRLEYLEQEPERAPLALASLLRAAVEDAQPLAAAKEVTLTLDGPGDLPAGEERNGVEKAGAVGQPMGPGAGAGPMERSALMGDSHLLMRAVQNLLDNAMRYTPAGGHIRVRWGHDDGRIFFAVEDTGPGIAAHDLPHLFTPLYRGEASRNRQTGGTGLGLSIARRIVQSHGGDLSAANGPAGGAVFTATLPAAHHIALATEAVAATKA